MYEYLKSLFEGGAITFDQFVAALESRKEVKLANLADGGYAGTKSH